MLRVLHRVGVPAIRHPDAGPEGVDVPKTVITRVVIDIERWLKGKTERAVVISAYAMQVTDYVAADPTNNIAVTADAHDMADLQALMAAPSPEDADLEEKHGVLPPMAAAIEKQAPRSRLAARPAYQRAAAPSPPTP